MIVTFKNMMFSYNNFTSRSIRRIGNSVHELLFHVLLLKVLNVLDVYDLRELGDNVQDRPADLQHENIINPTNSFWRERKPDREGEPCQNQGDGDQTEG